MEGLSKGRKVPQRMQLRHSLPQLLHSLSTSFIRASIDLYDSCAHLYDSCARSGGREGGDALTGQAI